MKDYLLVVVGNIVTSFQLHHMPYLSVSLNSDSSLHLLLYSTDSLHLLHIYSSNQMMPLFECLHIMLFQDHMLDNRLFFNEKLTYELFLVDKGVIMIINKIN